MDNFNRSFDPLAETILLLGTFAAEVPAEVEADREVLATLTERVGGATGGMNDWGAWSAEKVSRLKLKTWLR
jgi:hypothetical protein